MKVEYLKNTYLVHWTTARFVPEHGSPSRDITQTTCHIRELLSDKNAIKNTLDVCEGTVKEHSADVSNQIVARKLSLAKALRAKLHPKANKSFRTAFWKEFVKTARVTSRNKNKKMERKISVLDKRIKKLQKTLQEERAEVIGDLTGDFIEK